MTLFGDSLQSNSNSVRLRVFQRRIFWASFSWRVFIHQMRFFRLRRNKKCNDGGLNPAPHRYPLFHKKTRNCFIINSLTDPQLS